jgi:hypothetical protein
LTRLTEERIARNDAIFREANEAIREAAEAYEFTQPVPFLCECAAESCREIVRMPLDEYREIRSDPRQFLNAPGHEVALQGAGEVIARHQGYVIVEKQGHAGEVAEALADDPDPASTPSRARATE